MAYKRKRDERVSIVRLGAANRKGRGGPNNYDCCFWLELGVNDGHTMPNLQLHGLEPRFSSTYAYLFRLSIPPANTAQLNTNVMPSQEALRVCSHGPT